MLGLSFGSFALFGELERVDEPQGGNNKSVKEEHDGLFINNSIWEGVVIMMPEGFNGDGHESSGEEQA